MSAIVPAGGLERLIVIIEASDRMSDRRCDGDGDGDGDGGFAMEVCDGGLRGCEKAGNPKYSCRSAMADGQVDAGGRRWAAMGDERA